MADNYDNLYSCTVVDEDGSRIGAVSQVYLDDATAEPTFVAARVGFFGTKEVLVPLVGNHGLWAALMVLNGTRTVTLWRLYPKVWARAAHV